ncbi:pseudaminic acid synthase [Aliiglaciecola sp. CAU 1673]|uniref:pseudaminic acid synthase n=1 Tax=Aliiglaciecola sp. CAU 1673 TaxID=3032595 RepID=UPI0023D99904|nr:pseudaminic acid synthase [Aliiglaciecola sp. CAU 1673]MDF2178306.1 pseudaminic acid synthase [Aliiglaciecola sp. CAU 1673]
MTFRIGKHCIGADHPPFVIAEMSGNHNGDLGRALELVEQAKMAGASAIKLQTYTADTMTIDCDLPDFQIQGGLWDGRNLYELYEWAHTPWDWHKALFERARELELECFSSPFDESAVDFLESLDTPAYKVASFELLDLPLIAYMAKTGKPMIMSSGMANQAEIKEALTCAKDNGAKDIVLLHCISGYPTPIEQANLMTIPMLARDFGCQVGLSDHTLGTIASTTAIALGARVIEKHFTLRRADGGPDAAFSLEPEEFKRLTEDCFAAWQALGKAGYEQREAEKANLKFRRSIYVVEDIKAGDLFTEKNIRRIRPGYGLHPKHFKDILGQKARRDFSRGEPLVKPPKESS